MRTTFSNEELIELRKHKCVFSCTSKSVNYTYEFKKNALEEYEKGVRPKDIWKQAGFDTSKWKKDYFRLTIRIWSYKSYTFIFTESHFWFGFEDYCCVTCPS